MSASVTSSTWLPVRFMMPAKMDIWLSSRNVEKAKAKTRPKYLALSDMSILRATKFINWSCFDYWSI